MQETSISGAEERLGFLRERRQWAVFKAIVIVSPMAACRASTWFQGKSGADSPVKHVQPSLTAEPDGPYALANPVETPPAID